MHCALGLQDLGYFEYFVDSVSLPAGLMGNTFVVEVEVLAFLTSELVYLQCLKGH